jgi:hypothetical protein
LKEARWWDQRINSGSGRTGVLSLILLGTLSSWYLVKSSMDICGIIVELRMGLRGIELLSSLVLLLDLNSLFK